MTDYKTDDQKKDSIIESLKYALTYAHVIAEILELGVPSEQALESLVRGIEAEQKFRREHNIPADDQYVPRERGKLAAIMSILGEFIKESKADPQMLQDVQLTVNLMSEVIDQKLTPDGMSKLTMDQIRTMGKDGPMSTLIMKESKPKPTSKKDLPN